MATTPTRKAPGMKIKKGDRVVVLSGKDKGAEGVVERSIPEKGKVIVDGINIAKKHQAPTRGDQQGGIIEKAMPMDVSNVAVVSPKDGKATRVGYKILEDGTKVRICRRTGAELT
ncbi:MAG: large subunit ribosomal protein L24 [Candidatus Aldehydirespiratoraceae bacterium]|jgi:large subunit ribosomal protein L24